MRRTRRDTEGSARRINRRALVVGMAQTAIVGVLAWRMQDMQVQQADEFRLLAEENRINLHLIPPARGLIFDRTGTPLAENEQNYRIVLRREDAGDLTQALGRLAELIPLPQEVIDETIEEALRRDPFVPVTILDRVSWDDISKVTVNAPALPGIFAEVGLSRHYPLGSDTSHVVGYVGPVSEYDLGRMDDPDPVLQIPKFPIGKTGVEAKLEERLRGSAGTKQVEVNHVGRIMRELGRQEGDAGADLQLALDARLQAYAAARMEGDSASAVVIDLERGDLRAIASTPAFDPNLFVRGISVADWQGLNENDYRPLASKAVQDAYPPGSTFKMITLLAALEAGVIGPEETVYCPGFMEVAGTRFHCWRRGGHGNINLHQSLRQSCDVYYYEISQRVGIDAMAEMARKLGIGVRHDVPMSAVVNGIAPDKAWKMDARGEDWRIGDTVNASIGQGYVLSSPMQLAVMTARIATGRQVTPRLIHKIDGIEQPSGLGESLGINENMLRRVRASMYAVVNEGGTAAGSRFDADGAGMAGKTGTSQVRRITAEERARGVTSNEDLPWDRRDHALFVSYAPFDAPRFAVAVVVEHGGGGSAVAAPIARDVMLQALYDGAPPLEVYPSNVRDEIRERQARIAARVAAGGVVDDRA